MNCTKNLLLAFAAITLLSTNSQAVECDTVKNVQQRLACYDSTSLRKSGNPSNGTKSQSNCRGFEVVSNTLKLSLESGTLRTDMLASGISELIAKREECKLPSSGQQDKATYEQNINAFQDVYHAIRVAENICRTDRIAQAIRNCSPDVVPLSSGGMSYGYQEFYRPIVRHAQWIKEHCGGRDSVSNLISHILTTEVTGY